jgi:hypothetical protein
MTLIDDLCVSLRWDGQLIELDYSSPSDFTHEIIGKIIGMDEHNVELLIGTFKLYSIDVSAAFNDNISIYKVFDEYDETTIFYDLIFGDNEPDLSIEIAKLLDCSDSVNNILIIDRLEILPQFRGKFIGLLVLWKIIHRFARSKGIVIMKPYPLQFEHEAINKTANGWRNQMQLNQFDGDITTATEKLERLYQKLGFVKEETSSFMVRSNERMLPSDDAMFDLVKR